MRVGFLQLKPIFGKKEANLKKALKYLEKCQADLMVLPELFDTGYAFISKKETLNLASPIEKSDTIAELKKYSKLKKTAIVAGIAERDGKYLFNTAVTILPSGKIELYRKYHLFYREKGIFTPGNLPMKIIRYKDARIGMMICFDWIFPEMARTLTLKGANILCHPSNLVLQYCQKAMVTRCIENWVFDITCNRIGKEVRNGIPYRFTGYSRIIAPGGEVLAQGAKTKEQVVVTDINLEEAKTKKITPLNDILKDRRKNYYII
jgi:predicted amidohydrolase